MWFCRLVRTYVVATFGQCCCSAFSGRTTHQDQFTGNALPFSDILNFDVWSWVLAVIGAFWALIGDVACRAVHPPEGWKGELRKRSDSRYL